MDKKILIFFSKAHCKKSSSFLKNYQIGMIYVKNLSMEFNEAIL